MVVPYRLTGDPTIGEANLTLPGARGPQKRGGVRIACDPHPTPAGVTGGTAGYWARYISATRNARSSDWLRLSRGSQAVS
jgi:hypothetical protein